MRRPLTVGICSTPLGFYVGFGFLSFLTKLAGIGITNQSDRLSLTKLAGYVTVKVKIWLGGLVHACLVASHKQPHLLDTSKLFTFD